MARRATWLKQQREKTPDLLVLDAGDTFLGQDLADATGGSLVVDAMNLMGYNAMTLGERDLQAGADAMRRWSAQAHFALLGANLPEGAVARPYAFVKVGQREIAILGLTGDTEPVGGGLTPSDPVAAARRYLPELRKRTSVIIVLSHLGADGDATLAQAVPGLAAIIGGHSRIAPQPAQQVNGAVIASAGFNGEAVGLLTLEVNSSGAVTSFASSAVYLGIAIPEDDGMRRLIGPPP